MADEGGGGSPMDMLIFVFGGLALLIVLWYATGGPEKADLRGIFLQPPAPINHGDAYGPTIKSPQNNSNQQP